MTVQAALAHFRSALVAYDQTGRFSDEDYDALQILLGSALARQRDDLLDGLTGVFFERHLLNDQRRRELLALSEAELLRAIRHRFRQLLADERDEYEPFHALKAHVREVLPSLVRGLGAPPAEAPWPASIREKGHYAQRLVIAALLALWRETVHPPEVRTATAELFRRYSEAHATVTESQNPPEVLQRKLDGQRMAEGILALLSPDERDLLRHVLVEEGSVEEWAEARGCSRATAYRHMAGLKALCRLEFSQRSNRTQLEALAALRGRLY